MIIPPPDKRRHFKLFKRHTWRGKRFCVLVGTGYSWQMPDGRWFGVARSAVPTMLEFKFKRLSPPADLK